MGTDIAGVRFDAVRNYNRVIRLQGRLSLDADDNEQHAIYDRRSRAAAADLGSPGPRPGIAGTAVVPRTTPDAFALSVSGGSLMIGTGRMYIDGIAAENHGVPSAPGPVPVDPLLGGTEYGTPVPYTTQPYFTPAPALPTTGTHLVYLDVWEREITAVESPDLIDDALGVDTTARSQVVWQVRVHAPDSPGIDCKTIDSAIPGWIEVISASAGRLTVETTPVDPDDNPCCLPLSGGFRGRGNQTYRVEIHDPGPAGTATFKWSRENASITLAVTEVLPDHRLRLTSLGHDDILGLHTDDWCEIIDDHCELDGRPGAMRRIIVDTDRNEVSFDSALPAELAVDTAGALQRHLRVRRWDQSGLVRTNTGATVADLDLPTATGILTVPAVATPIVLEDGITATLTAPGGVFHTGDHWIFEARTGTAWVRPLVDAPPVGPLHHYARLGILVNGVPASDCRVPWPPEPGGDCGDCAVCVSAEEHNSGAHTIQMAIDDIAATGGVVCLGPGDFVLDRPAELIKIGDVHIHGQGAATRLVGSNDIFVIMVSFGITLSDFAVLSGGLRTSVPLIDYEGPAAAIRIISAERIHVEHLAIDIKSVADQPGRAVKMHESLLDATFRNNRIHAPIGFCGWENNDHPLLLDNVAIRENTMVVEAAGVHIDGQAYFRGDVTVADNRISGSAQRAAITARGSTSDDGATLVKRNHITIAEGAGILVGSAGITVTDNIVTAHPPDIADIFVANGITSDPNGEKSENSCPTRICGNQVSGFLGAAIDVRHATVAIDVCDNQVHDTGDGIAIRFQVSDMSARVSGNTLRDILSRFGGGAQMVAGILIAGAAGAEVADNTVIRVGPERNPECTAVGVLLYGIAGCRVLGNDITDVGYPMDPGQSFDCTVLAVSRITLHGNQSARQRGYPTADRARGVGLLVQSVLGDFAAALNPDTAYIDDQVVYSDGGSWLGNPALEPACAIDGNTWTGSIEQPAVVIETREHPVVLANNICNAPDFSTAFTVQIAGHSAAITGNHIRGGQHSLALGVSNTRLSVLGNLVSAGSISGLPAGFAPFNIYGVN